MRHRFRRFFWPVPVETEVDEEIAAHLDLSTRRYIAAGDEPATARAKALARFGDRARVEDECRTIRHHMETDMQRSEFRDDLRQDVIFALRGFRRSPLFTVVSIVTIALGVGASTAIFSVVDTVLLRPLPYANAERITVLFNGYGPAGVEHTAVSGGELFDFRETFRAVDAIAAVRPAPATLTADNADPETVSAYIATPNLFDVLGERAVAGRGFVAGDGRPNDVQVAVLSHDFWQRRFGGDSAVIGSTIAVNAVPRTVVGVMRAGMRFPDSKVGYASAPADLWVGSTLETTRAPQQRGNQNLVVIGRMAPGAGRAALDRDLADVTARFKREHPDRYARPGAKHWEVVAVSLRDEMVGTVRPALLMLTAAVAIVLLIACVNVANLLLARTAARQRELAVRVALGADRPRLVRQLLTESTILSLLGGLLGAGLAWIGIQGLRRYGVVEMPQLAGTQMDVTVLAFSLAITAMAGLLVGLLPAFQQSAGNPGSLLGAGARGSSAGGSLRRLRSALVVAQVAMALVVLNAAGLLGRSFIALQRVAPGFRPDGVMTAYVSLPRSQYDSAYKINAFYERLGAGLASIPGVTSVGGIYPLPVSNDGWSGSIDIEGYPAEKEPAHAEYAAAMPGYFRTMGIPLRGRDFTADDRRDAAAPRPLTVIVDETFAKTYWPGEEAIGRRISRDAETQQWMTVIGVAGHVQRDGPATPSEPQIYLPYLQHPQGMLYPVVRTSTPPLSVAGAMREAVRALDRNLPVSKQRPLADLQRDSIARQRFMLVLTGLFALVALILASTGLYGVMAYLVTQRTREIGIRVALGGRPSDVRGLVLRESLLIAGGGLIAGTAGSLLLSRGLSGMLYEITPTDPVTYATIAVLLMAVAGLAAFGPARRATRVDPLTALRQ